MFAKLKLNTQISFAIASILCLLLVVSITGFFGLTTSLSSLSKVRGLADDYALAADIRTEVLQMRVEALKFIDSHDTQNLEKYRAHKSVTESLIQTSETAITSPQRALLLTQASQSLIEYEDGFSKVTELIIKRDAIVNDELDPSGAGMREGMTMLLDGLATQNSQGQLYLAGKAQEALLLGRLYASKFLVSNNVSDYQRAIEELEGSLASYATQLSSKVKSGNSIQALEDFQNHFDKYLAALKIINRLVRVQNALFFVVVFDGIGY